MQHLAKLLMLEDSSAGVIGPKCRGRLSIFVTLLHRGINVVKVF